MKKRILGILLTLCMALSVVTPLVFAAENGLPAGNAEQTDKPLSLEEGETYWFEISNMISGVHRYYESFVYVGTVDSYVLNSASAGNADSSAAASAATDSYLKKTEVRGTPWNNEWDTIRVKGEIDPASLTRNYIKIGRDRPPGDRMPLPTIPPCACVGAAMRPAVLQAALRPPARA